MTTTLQTDTRLMTGLFLDQGNLTLRHDLPRPAPASGEALIRILVAGICATDLELVKGYAGGLHGVLGHEFVGIVEKCDDAGWVGQRIVGNINLGCYDCDVCEISGPEHCPNRTVLGIQGKDGVFAQYLTLPIRNLVAVPRAVANEQAVFTEPLAAAVRLTEQISFAKDTPIAVVGPGRLGMLIGKVLALHGGDVTVFGRSEASLRLPQVWGFKTDLAAAAPQRAFKIAVEATGNAEGLAISLGLVRPRGTLVLKSTFAGRTDIDLTKIVVDEITVVGSRCGPFDKALHLLDKKLVPVTDLIDGRHPLTEGLAAIDHAAQPGVRKILLDIDLSNT